MGVNMVNVLICEDNKSITEQIIEVINKFNESIKKNQKKFNISLVKTSGDGIIDYVKLNLEKRNVYILDIELEDGGNGIYLAKEIRKYDANGEIIFITSHSAMVMQTFKYKLKALDFIHKVENIEDKLLENLNVIYNNIMEEYKDPSITIKSGNRNYIFKFNEIINFYTSGINHKVTVSTIDGNFEFYGSLKNIEKDLDERFYKSHRCCILNKDYIKMINKDLNDLYVIMENGEKSVLSRAGLKGLIENELFL